MAIPTFFHQSLALGDTNVSLSESEIAHARSSRRLKAGQKISLLNGNGLRADGEISKIGRNQLEVSIDNFQEIPPIDRSIFIATAVPKGDRQRTMIDMLTQLGVSEVIALECDYSVTKVKEKLLLKWQRVAIEACKQSQNPWLPRIEEQMSVPVLLENLARQSATQGFYCDGSGEIMSKSLILAKPDTQTYILIGPEGGFSPAEIILFERAGIHPLRLAANILRTETAAITAAAQFRNMHPAS